MLTDIQPTAVTPAPPPLQQKRKLLKSHISVGSFSRFVEHIFWLTDYKTSSYVCFANVHMLTEAYQNEGFNTILNQADVAAPDGGPLSKLIKLLYRQQQERVAGMDLVPCLLQEAARRGKSVYFYGSTDEVLEAVITKATHDLPDLKIAGYYSPPFRKLTEAEDASICESINQVKPDLLFIALGCPKQERWMAEHKGKINSCMLGVGQAYRTYAGLEKRLPEWARNLSLEWTYRLWQEPGRLWKRYLLTNTLFILLAVKMLTRNIISRSRKKQLMEV